MSYTVNGEGWDCSHHLYRTRTHNTIHCSAVSLKDVIPFATSYSSAIEQRYTDQQIELLQKDEGWIVGNWDVYPMADGETLVVLRYKGNDRGFEGCAYDFGWKGVVAYRLVTNDHYMNGERVVLREGDYCVTLDLSYKENLLVIKAFETAAGCGSGICAGNVNKTIGWSFNCRSLAVNLLPENKRRELTLAQVLNAENAKPKENKTPDQVEWNGEPALPPVDSIIQIIIASKKDPMRMKVTGYHVLPDLDGDNHLSRVFVDLVLPNGSATNSRQLRECFPIRTEKERVIEKAMLKGGLIDSELEQEGFVLLNRLYDEDMLKMPEGEQ